jgi:predicted nucleotidyltransferase
VALQPLANHLAAAFVYGPVAKQSDTAASDVDLMVVSDLLTCADLSTTLENATKTWGRTVNPTVYTPQELKKRLRSDNAFVKRVMSQSKLWVIGTEHDLPA